MNPVKTLLNHPFTMTRLILAVSTTAAALLFTSCGCCTSDVKAPPLRPMPKFQPIPTPEVQPEVEVEYTK